MSATRILRSSGALLSHVFYADGVPIAADGTVTVTIRKADGTTLTSGSATGVGGPPFTSYTFTLPAQSTLNHLTVTWSGVFSGITQTQVDEVEIVGGFYLPQVELRSLDARFALAASPLIAAADLRRVLAEVEDAIEAEAGVSFVPRFARETLSGSGATVLMLDHMAPRSLLSARTYTDASTYTAFTAPELADLRYEPWGQVGRWSLGQWAAGSRNLVVEYEHGYDSPPPLIRRAARALFKLKMLEDIATTDPSLANVRSLSVEGYSVSYGDVTGTGSKVADDYIDQWKRSTTPAGVAIA